MDNLAQLFPPFRHATHSWNRVAAFALAALAIGGTGIGCGRGEPLPPAVVAATPPTTEAPAEPGEPDRGEMPEEPSFAAGPVAAWTYAMGWEEFHRTWVARFEILASQSPPESALLPYADAVTYHGASWGIQPAEIQLLLMDDSRNAYLTDGIQHPRGTEEAHRVSVSAPELDALGWTALQQGETVQIGNGGSGIRLVGAVRAGPSCNTCHDFADREWAGALIYRFQEIADD